MAAGGRSERRGIRILLLMLVALALPAPAAWAGSYEEGRAAYAAKDYAKAYRIWLPLAERGDVRAQHAVGDLYEDGYGVERDLRTAATWYARAAEQGHAESMYRLSVGYAWGLGGLERDDALAVKWLRRSADGGFKKAQKILAQGYERGKLGLPKDPQQAKYWFDKANAH